MAPSRSQPPTFPPPEVLIDTAWAPLTITRTPAADGTQRTVAVNIRDPALKHIMPPPDTIPVRRISVPPSASFRSRRATCTLARGEPFTLTGREGT
ncbi:hypothetical protein [Acanthopleuribacter pedis]|uniref:Uncharacterized protein n=1 Tax=Acanthopleuribacter pedis TaxID=442870 RepID=A0A8J7QST5_9BACT|nr:hypothetical protein [Acanthopleuribacter pedis]